MIIEDQSATVAFLRQPSTYDLTGPVEMMQTHISQIFLAGQRAFKLKRAVRFPYADFSTPALRFAACQKEVELNSRTAPRLYLGVRSIRRRADGNLTFDEDGKFVDAVVEMVRFDQSFLLDQMAINGRLELSHMDQVARVIADFHRKAPVVHARSGTAAMRAVLDVNDAAFEGYDAVFSREAVASLAAAFRATIDRHADLLDCRQAMGKVRRCHGDLHLRNICMFEGRPQLFDCIEFNDEIATIDTLYDLAFLLMDLWHRGLPQHANRVANHYLDVVNDEDGFVLLPFFMALRAAIRAHVTAALMAEGGSHTQGSRAEAQSYFELASALLRPAQSRFIGIGGLSGSGKSTVAEMLAPQIGSPPGARILESDRIRKAQRGVEPEIRLGADAYGSEVSAKVYAELNRRARLILSSGGTVIVDAVFANPSDRVSLDQMADDVSVHLAGFWLDADPTLLRARVRDRESGPSDATIDVLQKQLQQDLGPIGWKRLDATAGASAVVAQILQTLG